MVQPLDLTRAQLREFEATLRRSHEIRVDVDLLDLNYRVIGSVTPKMLTGQVLGDRHGFGEPNGPQRRLTLSLLDPHNALKVDTADPDDGVVYYDRLVQVHYTVRVPELGDWVSVPVFTGPPWRLQRDDAEVYIDADDASVLGWGKAWRPYTIPRGTRKIDAIRMVLENRAGFTRFRLPALKAELAHEVSLSRRTHPWGWAARIAKSLDLQLYVDGEGTVVARRYPTRPAWTFNPGRNGEIIDPVALTTDRERFANKVLVVGRKPKGAKRRVRYVATAPRRHPNSPRNLAMNGVPYVKLERIENDHFRSTKECRKKAERVLADRLRNREEMTCSILPWPHLEPGDMARFVTTGGEPTVDRVDTFTLPLDVEGAPPMTIGWFDKPAPHKGRVRR